MSYFLRIFALLLLGVTLWAAPSGSLSVYTFKNGTPLQSSEVIVDETQRYTTDRDGAVRIVLEAGVHQLQIIGKDAKGVHLGYYKKPFSIVAGRNTQIVASFDRTDEPTVSVDTPLETQTAGQADLSRLGTLVGFVRTSDQQRPIVNARVFVKGTGIDARTDEAGRFEVQIPADANVSISVVHSEYSAATLNDLVVAEGGRIEQSIELTPASMELEEFIVLAPKVEGSIASVMLEEKESKSIANILGSEEMSKKGDGDAASALKRVTGVTLIGGKSIYVRGLGDRYSNVELNSMPLPSPDPTKRVVPLDIFPSGVISSLKVQKSATADIPANFGGGYVDIRTKEKSSEDYFKLSFSAKGNSNTGKNVAMHQGGGSDWMGIDDGYRAVPSQILDASKVIVGSPVTSFNVGYGFTEEELEGFTKSILDRKLTPMSQSLPYGGGLSVEGAYNFDLADDHTLSLFANYAYDQEHSYIEEHYKGYLYNQATNTLYKDPIRYGVTKRAQSAYTHSGIFNLSYNYADVFHAKYTKLYTLTGEALTKINDGVVGVDGENKIRYDLNWEERDIDVDQISGDFLYNILDVDNDIQFGLEQATATLDQPGNYKYGYLKNIGYDGIVYGDPFLHRYTANVFLNMTSVDELDAYYVKNKTSLSLVSDNDYIQIGASGSTKERASRYNKYLINQGNQVDEMTLTQDIDTIYDQYVYDTYTGLFKVDIAFQPAYWFDATVEEKSVYANLYLEPTEQLQVLIGLKHVDWSQTVYEYTNDNNIRLPIYKKPETLAFDDLFPSLSLKYRFDDKNQIDFAYSKTFIVPDLREYTSAEYFHPYDVATVMGNPDLVNTFIFSYDLKYAHYFSDVENITFGIFYKLIEDPIEDVMLPSTSLEIYSFDNADHAVLYGFEIDGRKDFGYVDDRLNDFYLSGNFSYTDSDVTLRQEQEAIYTENHRQLQGLSQIVINLSLGYETKERSAVLSYNKMGERIRKVGMNDAGDKYPDYIEIPPQLLDFTWIERLNKEMSLTVKLGNIIDDETVWKQGSNTTNKIKSGRTYSAGFSYKF